MGWAPRSRTSTATPCSISRAVSAASWSATRTPKVVEAVQRQAAKFSHTDFSVVPYEIYVELAERLVPRVGPGRKVALFNSGAEAVENAVKFAKAATGRQAVSASRVRSTGARCSPCRSPAGTRRTSAGSARSRRRSTGCRSATRTASSDPDRAGQVALEDVERAFATVVDPHAVAAVIFEPVLGEGGYVVPGPEFLPGVQALCRRRTDPDDRRRDPVRVRAHGHVPGGRALRVGPRHRDPGEGARRRISALRRGRPQRDHGRPGPLGDRRHLRRQPGRVRRRDRGPRRDRGRGSDRARGRRRQGDPLAWEQLARRPPGGRRRPRPGLP